jgi:pyruvate, orthophosphate dikinase
MAWADKHRALKVRTNADNPRDAKVAYDFGAQGIGLCRTEHMFFEADRIPAVREMIVAKTLKERERALAKLLTNAKRRLSMVYKEMKGYPVTVRYLDPPLHEFLPTAESDIRALAKEMGLTYEELSATINELHETNPMLGHRGVRLSLHIQKLQLCKQELSLKRPLK